jgi:hypothetical protein
MDLADKNTFDAFFLVCLFVSLAYFFIGMSILKARKVDTKSPKVLSAMFLSASVIIFLPFWFLADLPWTFQVFVPLASIAIGGTYTMSLIRVGKLIKRWREQPKTDNQIH